jgi:hypothetical protein
MALAAFLLVLGGPGRELVAAEGLGIFSLSGYLESDTRFIVEDHRGGHNDGYRINLNRNDVNFRLGVLPYKDVRAVVDTRFRFYGFSEAITLTDLARRERVDPYALYLDEAYVMARGVIWDGLDLRIGRIVQNWGSVDQFNPIDQVNKRDFSDPMDYGKKVPNQMVEVNLYPTDWLSVLLVWVPIFKPAMLPDSAAYGFAVDYDTRGCFQSAPIPPLSTGDLKDLEGMFASMDPCGLNFVSPEVRTLLPDSTIENSQAAARFQFLAGPVNLNFTYYYGRFGFPAAYTAAAFVQGNPDNPAVTDVKYVAEVLYPRIHMAGVDFNYSAPWLFDVGFMGEIAVFFPETVRFGLRAWQGETLAVEKTSINIPSDPFIKATVGMDYTFTSWLYVNAMFVHGFFDEFNDQYGLHNYVVGAAELKFKDDAWQVRLAGVFDLNDHSAALSPHVKWIVFPSAELTLATMYFIGDTDPGATYDARSKFGHRAAGRSTVSFQAKVSW